jgi:hypothetical protein
MTQESVKQLIRLIEHEAELYKLFLDATMKQRQALIDNVERDISAITADQDRLLRQISATERSSLAVMSKCARELGMEEPVTIAAIAQLLSPSGSEALTSASRGLLETGAKVKSENMINRYLINNLIQLTGFCLRSIAGINPNPPAYRPNGVVLQKACALALDSRV